MATTHVLLHMRTFDSNMGMLLVIPSFFWLHLILYNLLYSPWNSFACGILKVGMHRTHAVPRLPEMYGLLIAYACDSNIRQGLLHVIWKDWTAGFDRYHHELKVAVTKLHIMAMGPCTRGLVSNSRALLSL